MSAGIEEHADAVADARAHLAAAGGTPLRPLPPGFGAARAALHRVAEDVLKVARERETGNEIALRFTAGGFGTPPWERGLVSGTSGAVRVDGLELVTVAGAETRREPLADPAVDAASAAAIADWFAFGTAVLGDLVDAHRGDEPAPIRLWPEHFDVATELGAEAAGSRATYGASPGDELHPEPYLYVSAWAAPPPGPEWNATGFAGAELGYAELFAAADQGAAASRFFESRLAALVG
jgi:hypothetical protein